MPEDEHNTTLKLIFARETITAHKAAYYLLGYIEADTRTQDNSINQYTEILLQLPHPYDHIVGYESVNRPFLFYIEGCIEKELPIYEPIKSFAIERLKLILNRDPKKYEELKESYPLLLEETGINRPKDNKDLTASYSSDKSKVSHKEIANTNKPTITDKRVDFAAGIMKSMRASGEVKPTYEKLAKRVLAHNNLPTCMHISTGKCCSEGTIRKALVGAKLLDGWYKITE